MMKGEATSEAGMKRRVAEAVVDICELEYSKTIGSEHICMSFTSGSEGALTDVSFHLVTLEIASLMPIVLKVNHESTLFETGRHFIHDGVLSTYTLRGTRALA